MKYKIIADTCIWIEYFKNNSNIVPVIEKGLNENSVYITGPIISELLQGIKTEKEYETLSYHIKAVPYLECSLNEWLKAGQLSNNMRRNGITVPLTDIVISAVAINNSMHVFSFDKHFMQIPEVVLHDMNHNDNV